MISTADEESSDDEDDEDDEGDEDDDEQDQEDDDDANTMVSASPIMNKKEPLDDVIEELELAAIKEEDAPVIAVEEVSPRSPLEMSFVICTSRHRAIFERRQLLSWVSRRTPPDLQRIRSVHRFRERLSRCSTQDLVSSVSALRRPRLT